MLIVERAANDRPAKTLLRHGVENVAGLRIEKFDLGAAAEHQAAIWHVSKEEHEAFAAFRIDDQGIKLFAVYRIEAPYLVGGFGDVKQGAVVG